MTNKVNALVVVLDQNIREDDVQVLVDAIKCFRHVLDVKLNVADLDSYISDTRAKQELITKLLDVLQ